MEPTIEAPAPTPKAATAKRRYAGDGSVYRSDALGLWVAAVRFPVAPLRRFAYGHSKTEANERRRDLLKAREKIEAEGGEGSKDLLRNYLPTWLKAMADGGAKPKTLECYERTVNALIIPHVGDLVLGKVTGYDAHRFLDVLKDAGKSNNTRRYAFRVLRSALGYAVHLRAIPNNPFAGIKPPKHTKAPAAWWTPDEANQFLRAHAAHPDYPLYVTALDTGLRIGELLGLQWADGVDLKAGTLRVDWNLVEIKGKILGRFPPKTERSRRTVPLTPRAIAALRGLLQLRSPWVFPSSSWGPRYQSNVTRRFRRAVAAVPGLPRLSFHDLRHTHASVLVRAEVDHSEAAARMGHTVTMFENTYVHVSQDQAQAVVDKFTAAMGAE